MNMIFAIGKVVATAATLWIGYNMLVFAGIAAGHQMKYIPYLNFPIKFFVAALMS